MNKFALVIIAMLFFACGSDNPNNGKANSENAQTENNKPKKSKLAKQSKQFNITVLLDLSDRIDPKKHAAKPEHFERDIANIKYLTELFVSDMESKGSYMAKGKIKIIFSPRLQDPNANIIAEKLNVDLSVMDNKQKKDVHDHIVSLFTDNLSKIYKETISKQKWIGSDIWRFFKNDVKDYCVDSDADYRNILIILTDGYIYHEDSKDQLGNRFAYLLPETISRYHLRNNPSWEKQMEKKDFGLISKRDDLDNLEVLVLEISPSPNYKNDEDVIKAVLAKWFEEMKVKRFAIYNTDLPEYTKQRIYDFIK